MKYVIWTEALSLPYWCPKWLGPSLQGMLRMQLLSGRGTCGAMLGAWGSAVLIFSFSIFCLNSMSQGTFYSTDS